jgi:zinc transporter
METAGSNYGSDRNGLVWGYVLGAGREAAPIDSEGAARWLATAASAEPDRFVWLHFSLANAACRSWLRTNLDLPDAFHDELREGTGSTRLERDGDALLAVVHDVLFDFTFDASDVSTVSLCVQPQVMISARLKPLRSLDRLRASMKAGDGFASPAGLLAQLLRDQAGVLADILRQATGRVDEIEDKVLTSRISVRRTELGALRRVLVRLQRLLAPEPAALPVRRRQWLLDRGRDPARLHRRGGIPRPQEISGITPLRRLTALALEACSAYVRCPWPHRGGLLGPAAVHVTVGSRPWV